MTKQAAKTKMLILLFAITYMISYITRINFGAIIAEIEHTTGISKQLLSAALTGSFITYGAGQIVSGICGDRISPKKLVLYGLAVTVLMNVLIPFCKNSYQMAVIWSINGFAQAFMWPPIVKLMVVLLPADEYNNASVKVSWGSSLGSIVVYLLSPVIILLLGWRSVFFVCATFGIIMMFVWNVFCLDVGISVTKTEGKTVKTDKSFFSPVFMCVMLAIVLQGMLRDGVTTWMPSYISETYGMSNAVSILLGAVLPVFSMLCFWGANKLYTAKFKNPVSCAGFIFGIGSISAALLLILFGKNSICSVALMAILTGCMHGVNLLLICITPAILAKDGNVSTVSGILNSCTYVGSAISTYGIAAITENFGWRITTLTWLVVALAGTITCFAASNMCHKTGLIQIVVQKRRP